MEMPIQKKKTTKNSTSDLDVSINQVTVTLSTMTHSISSAIFNSLLFSALINKLVNLCWTRLKLSLPHYFSSEWNYWGRYFEEMKKAGIFQSAKWFWNVKKFFELSFTEVCNLPMFLNYETINIWAKE